jgi:squalene cyclase
VIEAIIHFLLEAQNPDGGWGAKKDKQSNTEATSLTALALHTINDPALTGSIDRGLSWLAERQLADGSWPLTPLLETGSWVTPLTVFTLAFFETHHQRALRGAAWLLGQRGSKPGWFIALRCRWAPQTMPIRLDPSLDGWSWTPNAFSFVEPTAYALTALKKLRPFLLRTSAAERIHKGELLIHDRMCKGGGWNYGNSAVFGKELSPYPDTTAIALIALQDHQTTEANQQSLTALRSMMTHIQSGLALSWAILCFALYGEDTSEWQQLLVHNYEKSGFLGEIKTLALALLASQASATVFQV